MGVRSLSNGHWIADRTINKRRYTRTCKTEEEARYWDMKFQFEHGSQQLDASVLAAAGPSLREYIEDVYWPSKRHLRKQTAAVYERVIRASILPELGDVPFNKITPQMVQRLINSCSSRRSAQLAREVLSSILASLVDGVIYSVNPAGLHFTYPPPNLTGRRSGVVLSTFAEHDALLAHVCKYHAGEAIERLVVLGLCFGLRPEEVYGLDVENLYFEERMIYIDQVYVEAKGLHLERTKTPKGTRMIPMTDYAFSRLASWDYSVKPTIDLYGQPAHPVVVNSKHGRISTSVAHTHIDRLRLESLDSGIQVPRITQENLRHSYGTAMAVEGNMDLHILKELMGHEDISTTSRYIRPQADDLTNAVQSIEKARKASAKAAVR